ncbi:hypothetical protein JCGZ_13523 [Jatropha curcas]|uniref:Aminotransferase-like plant mobile domain-containing protein n=1 Tax=Jatropha curcas TaxID=180498 RepID=A0A067KAY2_JATCU|nr:hypothetical protein JCGZ_13523 [Jatropha curcas]
MSQLSEIPAFAYTPEMETLGAIPDIPTFDGEPVPTSRMRGFQTEVDLGKARSGGSSTDALAFWDLLDSPMRARLVAADFGDYTAGLRYTQHRFPPAMRYALMERWNDCTHTFVFGFGEMTLTPVDYAAITGLRFAGPVTPLDARYQTATLGAQLVGSFLVVTARTRYTTQGCVSYEVVYRFWAERIRTRLAAWRELPVEARPAAPAYTREERDQAARSFLFYIISSQLLCTSQNKGDPAVLVCLRDLGQVVSFDWATLALAHLYHGLDVWTRGSGESNWQFIRPLEVWAYEYHIYPGGPSGDSPADSRRIPQYLAHCHHTYASTEDPEYWRSFLNDSALSDLLLTPWEGEAWRTYPGSEAAPAHRQVSHAPPRHMCMLEGMTAEDREKEYEGSVFLSAGDYAEHFSTRMQSRLPEVLEYTQEQKKHKTVAHYRAEAAAEVEAAAAPTGPAGVVLGDVPFPPSMEVVLDPSLGLGSAIIIPADLRQAPPPPRLDPEHATHLRDTRSCASGADSPGPSLADSTPSGMRGFGDRETAEAPVSPVRCYGLTPDGGGSASDEAKGGGYPTGLLRGGR